MPVIGETAIKIKAIGEAKDRNYLRFLLALRLLSPSEKPVNGNTTINIRTGKSVIKIVTTQRAGKPGMIKIKITYNLISMYRLRTVHFVLGIFIKHSVVSTSFGRVRSLVRT